MFNLFNKQKQENPISDVFSSLTSNQKMSVMNLLLTIGVCDGEQGDANREMQYLNTYVNILGVRSDKCMAYLQSMGHERIISDLKTISRDQKEILVVAAWEMIMCDGRANETELTVAVKIFEQLGISEDQFIETIEKTQALMNHYYGK
jgi:uncharacterized tellurite resistance protein B-like protein